jgi:DedD protein
MRTIVEEEEKEGTDTEITLGMKSLLGVFFGSVLVCGVFFGFGYSLGRGTAHPNAATVVSNPAIAVKPSAASDTNSSDANGPETNSSDTNGTAASGSASTGGSDLKTVVSDPTPTPSPSSNATPSATSSAQYEYVPTPDGPARRPLGAPDKSLARKPSPASALASGAPASAPAYTKPSAAVVQPPAWQAQQPPAPLPAVAPRSEPAALTATRPASSPQRPLAIPASTPAPVSAATGSTMVQIAAVSHQEDATILVSALRKRGYAVVVRNEPKDSLFHVQVGPFASRDEAKAMRARLLGDGYNAILK